MPFPPKMHAFDAEISCDESLMSLRNTDYSAVVPDTGDELSCALSQVAASLTADSRDQPEFG